jgi:hypothetical protein
VGKPRAQRRKRTFKSSIPSGLFRNRPAAIPPYLKYSERTSARDRVAHSIPLGIARSTSTRDADEARA